MTKPDFSAMSQKELRTYVLEHREDEEPLSILVERVKADPSTKAYPPLKSIDDLQNFPEVIEQFQKLFKSQGRGLCLNPCNLRILIIRMTLRRIRYAVADVPYLI